jgi:polyferredoxin
MKSKIQIAVKRKIAQFTLTLLFNAHIPGFLSGRVYSGSLKKLCAPGLNCYSCPGALGSCPLGALQNLLADPSYKMSFYVIGTLSVFGILFGRLICGFMCPIGLLQELLHRITPDFIKKRADKRTLPKAFRWFKYGVLLIFVIALPLWASDAFGFGKPWFCQYICPSGMVMGALPLLLANPSLTSLTGAVFQMKLWICAAVLTASFVSYRFFCKYLCPLGAVYGLFNRLSFYRIRADHTKCSHCGLCAQTCAMGVNPRKTPNSAECIRCGQCVEACPQAALSFTAPLGRLSGIVTKHPLPPQS